METRKVEALEKLQKENKRLKTTNTVLVFYLIISLIIMGYNYFI